MAIANMIANNPAQFNWADEEFTFNTKDYPIGGKLVGTSLDITFADVDRFLTDEDFDTWTVAADLLLFPYRSNSNSGVLGRAKLYNKKVVN